MVLWGVSPWPRISSQRTSSTSITSSLPDARRRRATALPRPWRVREIQACGCGPTTRAWCSSTTSRNAEEETGAGERLHVYRAGAWVLVAEPDWDPVGQRIAEVMNSSHVRVASNSSGGRAWTTTTSTASMSSGHCLATTTPTRNATSTWPRCSTCGSARGCPCPPSSPPWTPARCLSTSWTRRRGRCRAAPDHVPGACGGARDPAASPSGHPRGDGVRGAGSRRPGPARRHRPGGARPVSLDLGASMRAFGVSSALYADNVRRLALAEADLYLEELEKPWAGSGVDESELMLRGAEVGRRMAGPVERTIRALYERQRQHIWTEYGAGWPRHASNERGSWSVRSRRRRSASWT